MAKTAQATVAYAPVNNPIFALQPTVVPPVVKVVQGRYAPTASIANPQAVITYLAPNPKLPGSKAQAKYNLFALGQTVQQVTAAFVAAGYKPIKARNQLRWDIQHGYVVLG